MKLGFFLRKLHSDSLRGVRNLFNFSYYCFWLVDPSKFSKIDTSKIRNILVIYSPKFGDIINSVGLINSLKEQYPRIKVYYLAEKDRKPFLVSPHITFVNLKEAKVILSKNKIDAVISLGANIVKKEIFDLELYFKLLKVPYRISCDSILNKKYLLRSMIPLLSTRKIWDINTDGSKNHLKAFNSLGFKLTAPTFAYTSKGESSAKSFIKKNKIKKDEAIVFLHVGAGTILSAIKEGKLPSHLWPSEKWAGVADYLIEYCKSRIIFTGVGKERILVEEVISRMVNKKNVIKMVDKLSIEESASLLKRGNLLIAIDTGIVHLAAQTGIPIIDLFGPMSPKAAAPLSNSINLFHPEVCTYCRKYACPEGNNICMKAITVSEVLEAASNILNKEGK